MTIQTENNIKIQRFFFGEMAEKERFEFEQTFAANPELLEEMRAFEADLIEKYVRGWMSGAEKLKFEQHFLSTEKRRQKVEFSRQLVNELRQETNDEAEKVSIRHKIAGFFLTPKIAMATAFSVLILIFGGWFLLKYSETEKTEIVKNKNSANIEIENTNIAVNTVNSNKQSETNRSTNIETNSTNVPVNSQTPTKTTEPKKTPIPKTAPNPVLALFAGTLRDGGGINELNLPKNSSGATLSLNLKSVDYQTFQAEITDGNGKIVYQSGNLRAQKSMINLFVPAKNLDKGDYRINLYGKNPAGENESAADFQFRVN